MEYKKTLFSIIIWSFLFLSICSTGCKSQQAVIVDTGDIEQLRSEYQRLRNEYECLQSNYSRLIDDSKFFADYYANAVTAITAGVAELDRLAKSSAGEIQLLRGYVTILRTIINNIINGESGKGYEDTKPDNNKQEYG